MTLIRRPAAGSWIALFAAACATGRSAPPSLPAPPAPASASAAPARPADVTKPLRTLVVGGGPTRTANQVAIESNVR